MNAQVKRKIAEAIAHILADDLAAKSIALECENKKQVVDRLRPQWEKEWVQLRQAFSNVNGWLSYEDTLRRVEEALQ